MNKFVLLSFCLASAFVFADGIEPVNGVPYEAGVLCDDNGSPICNTTQWGHIPTDACVKDVVECCGVSGAPTDYAQVKEDVSKLKGDVVSWSSYWGGDDFLVVITNYPTVRGANRSPSGRIPQLRMSWKTSDDDGEYQQVVWDETWWQDWLKSEYLPNLYFTQTEINSKLDDKADRAWGYYDSHNGLLSPDGYTQISSERIIVAKDMSYQQTITSAGNVWVLTANGVDMQVGCNESGFFTIEDGEGTKIIEIIKGDKRVVGAMAGGITVHENVLTIEYFVDSDSYPKIEICSDIKTQDWKMEGTDGCIGEVSWGGVSGHYTATVTITSPRAQAFVRATYEIGGETFARHNVPLAVEYIYLGGVKYRLGTATISGNKVLTLTEVH